MKIWKGEELNKMAKVEGGVAKYRRGCVCSRKFKECDRKDMFAVESLRSVTGKTFKEMVRMERMR